jgi:hypothetical protein
MEKIIAIIVLTFVSLAFAKEGEKYGIGLTGTISFFQNDNIWFPVFTLSDYFIRKNAYHDLSIEYMNVNKKNDEKILIEEWSLNYAYLFKLPIKVIAIGPTVGMWYFNYEKQYRQNIDTVSYWRDEFEKDTYFGGGKIAVILGEKNIRIVIKQLILLGSKLKNGNTRFGWQSITQVGLMYAF